jgi:hypothetical protein
MIFHGGLDMSSQQSRSFARPCQGCHSEIRNGAIRPPAMGDRVESGRCLGHRTYGHRAMHPFHTHISQMFNLTFDCQVSPT